MVHVEQGSLGAFEQHPLAPREGLLTAPGVATLAVPAAA